MANEATLLVELEPAVNVTVANATGIEQGALLKLTDHCYRDWETDRKSVV